MPALMYLQHGYKYHYLFPLISDNILFDAIISKIHDERKDMIVERLKQYEDTYRDFDMYYE